MVGMDPNISIVQVLYILSGCIIHRSSSSDSFRVHINFYANDAPQSSPLHGAEMIIIKP
jgi:hypothetical protein